MTSPGTFGFDPELELIPGLEMSLSAEAAPESHAAAGTISTPLAAEISDSDKPVFNIKITGLNGEDLLNIGLPELLRAQESLKLKDERADGTFLGIPVVPRGRNHKYNKNMFVHK